MSSDREVGTVAPTRLRAICQQKPNGGAGLQAEAALRPRSDRTEAATATPAAGSQTALRLVQPVILKERNVRRTQEETESPKFQKWNN